MSKPTVHYAVSGNSCACGQSIYAGQAMINFENNTDSYGSGEQFIVLHTSIEAEVTCGRCRNTKAFKDSDSK